MTVNEEGIINFHVANRAATHLGRKLYSTTPPALAELIANSYDAYATEVRVTIDKDIDHIIVADNGTGMSLDGLNEKYALVGKEKVAEAAPEGFTRRSPMGQKGIGKLASFSLGDEYEVYTKTATGTQWRHFAVKYADFIRNDSEYPVESELCELPYELEQFSSYDHGFITIIRGLRRGVNSQTFDSLKTQLSRRFYIKSGTGNFALYINGQPIDLSLNAYYGSMDYATYIGFTGEEIRELLNVDDDTIELEQYDPKTIKDEAVRESLESLIGEKGLKGWVGTVEQPKQLKEHGNNANVVVYINGKIADEDVLKNHANSMIANQYVVGEFFADYLSADAEDPITSSRQGLDNADSEVRELISVIKSIRSTVINTWDNRRENGAVKRLPAWATDDKGYQDWLAGLGKSQRRLHNRLVKTLTVKMDESEQDESEMRALLNSFIDVVENNAIYQLADELSSETDCTQDELLVAMARLLNRIAASESIKQAGIVSERLRAIKTLQSLMDDDSPVEKMFEEHLAQNPWLINPYWNQTPKTSEEVQVVTQEFNRLYTDVKDDEYRRTFIDICIYVAEETYPIIVELKRNADTSYSHVNYSRIYEQINAYRQAILQKLGLADGAVKEDAIPAYFIGSEKMGPVGHGFSIELSESELGLLKQSNITVLTYQDLILHAERAYHQHIEVIEQRGDIPYFEM